MSAHSLKNIVFCLTLVFLEISCIHDKTEDKVVREVKDYIGKAMEALNYCKDRNLNTSFYILIDLAVHSGYKRFFIWDFNKACITDSFLVSHGCGPRIWGAYSTADSAIVSNEFNSHCSSVGKYIIGDRGPSTWGVKTKYLLHGMDPTNSNALNRAIVFHSWDAVRDIEPFPRGVPEGWGCPAISNKAFTFVDSKLRGQTRRTLMWIIKEPAAAH